MKISVQIEGFAGLTWEKWRSLTTVVEQMGFDGVFCSDHFATLSWLKNSLDVFTALTDLAGRGSSLHFGTLVAPFSFRDPIMMTRQAMAIDDLSGGRMILGVGAGWNESEHEMFGYHLGDIKTRLDRFAEGLEVVSGLIRSDGPVSFEGQFYQLKEADLTPRPARKMPLLVGGGGPKRTLPLAARYADIWNLVGSVESFIEKSALLDDLLIQEGRKPEDVERTVMVNVQCWRNKTEMDQLMGNIRRVFEFIPKGEEIKHLKENMSAIAGEPDEVIDSLRAYAEAGVDEVMLQWFTLDDTSGLKVIAEKVMPSLR